MANQQRTGLSENKEIGLESYNPSYRNVLESLVCFPAGKGLAGLSPRIIDRFLSKITIGQPNQCWLWQAGRFAKGYGMFNAGRDAYGTQDTRYAHRVAFQLATGIEPGPLVVMHSCDNPPCCNPAHLSLGTQRDNLRDASAKGRLRTGLRVGSVRWKAEQLRLGLRPDGRTIRHKRTRAA